MSTLELVRLDPDPDRDAGAAPGPLQAGVDELSPRELVVLAQLLAGGTLEEIAATLWVTRNTVKSQVRSLYRKLGVSTRADAVAWATSAGLHPPRSSTAWHKSDQTGRDSRIAR